MMNKKQVLISLAIPFVVIFIIPFILLWLPEERSLTTLWNQNLFLLIIGLFILGLGLLLFIECNWLFYTIGKGTLAPIPKIETRSMVIKGPYRYVRNPMILSVILVLLAESFLFTSISILIYTGLFFLINAIYMPLSEEKGMIARFGNEYLQYKENVGAWFPKLHSYSHSKNLKEVKSVIINAQKIADRLAYSLERGRHYKRAGNYMLRNVMDSGLATGVEIQISGNLTSPQIQNYIIRAGVFPKSSQVAQERVDNGVAQSELESGIIEIMVKITLKKSNHNLE